MRPKGIPESYVETSAGVWAHPSRVRRGVEASQPEQDGGRALDREAPAPQGGGTGLGGGAGRKPRRRGAGVPKPAVVLRIHLAARFRLGRLFDGHDNLAASLKPLVDAIAGTLGLPDKDSRIAWEYSQAETRGEPCVIVTFESVPGRK